MSGNPFSPPIHFNHPSGSSLSASLLYRVVCANECRNMHHKLVMNSLQHLRGDDASKWRDQFVRYYELYLLGSKDPDTRFKDFRNHVLHVNDKFWGGAITQANQWYGELVSDLQVGNWKQAVYSAGVLSHYFMDPLMPLHTGQTEEECVIHRACEWSINQSFDRLKDQLENGDGYPAFELPTSTDWLTRTVMAGASLANQYYQTFIDHYNIEVGIKDPTAALDDKLRQITSKLIGYASVGFARILERAFEESQQKPASTNTTLMGYLTALTFPFGWASKKISAISDRAAVKKIYSEYKKTGKVIRSLPADEKTVRLLHAKEILQIDIEELNQREIGSVGTMSTAKIRSRKKIARTKRRRASRESKVATESSLPESHQPGSPSTPSPNSSVNNLNAANAGRGQTKNKLRDLVSRNSLKFHLGPNEPLGNAPSIGPKTAARFLDLGIATVGDLIIADPNATAVALNCRHIDADDVRDWQTQAKLVCQIPGINGQDAQILVACGFDDPQEIVEAEPDQLLSLIDEFIASAEGQSASIEGKKPNLQAVEKWIQWSKRARPLQAA